MLCYIVMLYRVVLSCHVLSSIVLDCLGIGLVWVASDCRVLYCDVLYYSLL